MKPAILAGALALALAGLAQGQTYRFAGGLRGLLPHGARLAGAYAGRIPALDHAVGPTITAFRDVRTARLPPGCAYNPRAAYTPMGKAGAPGLQCVLPCKPGAPQSLDIEGLDFFPGGTEVFLLVSPSPCAYGVFQGSVKIRNNNFGYQGSLYDAGAIPANNDLTEIASTSSASVDVTWANNRWNDPGPDPSGGFKALIIDGRCSGNTKVIGNAFIFPSGREYSGPYRLCPGGPTPGHNTVDFEDNAVLGDVSNPRNKDHGELFEVETAGAINLVVKGNLLMTTTTQGPSVTALVWASNGFHPEPGPLSLTILSADIEQNLWIVNVGPKSHTFAPCKGARSCITASRVFGWGGSLIAGPTRIANNYVYAPGAYYRFVNDGGRYVRGAPQTVFSGNVDLCTGQPITGYDDLPTPKRPACGWTPGTPYPR